jgi:predicted transcriptional regulator
VLFRRKSASAREVWSDLGGDCSYSTIRKILSILEEKGFTKHSRDKASFIYTPAESREAAADSVIDRLVNTFFEGSVGNAVSGLLGRHQDSLSSEDLDELGKLIAKAKKEKGEK